MKNQQTSQLEQSSVRLDRWLWAARFFKTRALAKQAIEGGKVHLNGQRSKPARSLSISDILSIRRGFEVYEVTVMGLSDKRGPAKVAVTLYQETQESTDLRAKEAEIRRIQQLSVIPPAKKPDKRQRRKIHQFKQSQN